MNGLGYPRCAACGLEVPRVVYEDHGVECQRCGENAVVTSPAQHMDYDRERMAEARDV